MKLTNLKVMLAALGMLASTASMAGPWNAWSVGTTGSTVVNGDGSVTFTVGTDTSPVWTSGQDHSKAFYSTSTYNGLHVSDLFSVGYTMLSPSSLTGLEGPYLNIAVTDGTGGFSFLLADAAAAPVGQQNHVLSQSRFKFAGGTETNGTLAAYVATLTADAGGWYSYTDVANLTIAAGFAANPGAVTPIGGSFIGTGTSDGVILALGNRSSSPQLTSTITGVNDVPEPVSLALVGVALAGLAHTRRKQAA